MFDNENFVEQLLLKAMPNSDDDAINLIIEDVKPVLYNFVITHIYSKLKDSEAKEFSTLIKKQNGDIEVKRFLESTISGYEDFIENVYKDFEKKYLEEFKYFSK